jgi:GWxTD domain-containing protein
MKRLRMWAFLPLLVQALVLNASQVKARDLPQRYQDWLKVVSYIMLPGERDVFLRLLTDRERDIFIESFWKQRDPTAGTPQNEYQAEHLRRFNYANEYYGRGAPRAGWMTDMGRTYIILGPPNSIERFDSVYGVYPCQVWYYYGDKSKGLPTYFGLLFFQKGGGGEYRLYNPASDGPASLLIDTSKIDQMNYGQIYEKLKELAPTLVGPAFSIIPDERPYYNTPSPRNAILLAQIFDSPKKDVNPSYATHFLDYKGIVSTEYLTNFIESSASAAVVHDPVLGLNVLHFSISPKTISVDYFEPRDQYYCNFKLSVSLRHGDEVVFQYSKDYPFYFPPDKLANVQSNGISVLDLFPIADGTYGLTVLLQNAVGKEFSVFEKKLTVASAGGVVRLGEPVLGYKLEDSPVEANVPFRIRGRQLFTDPKATLGLGDEVAFCLGLGGLPRELWSEGVVEVSVARSTAKDNPVKVFTLKLDGQPYSAAMNILQAFPARDLQPDYYEMTFALKDGQGKVLGTASVPFIVSTSETIPHPVTLVRALPTANNFLLFYGLAIQYDKTGNPAKAEEAYRKAYGMNPDYPQGVIDFSEFLLRSKKFDEALRLVAPLRDVEKFRFDYFLISGRAHMAKGQFGPAVQSLLEGNKLYNSDTRLLNALGYCYYKTGKKKEAQDALAASLRLNPEQPDIKDLAAKVEKELK